MGKFVFGPLITVFAGAIHAQSATAAGTDPATKRSRPARSSWRRQKEIAEGWKIKSVAPCAD